MSRIAELRASLTSTATDTGLPVLITRKEWAEFVREYKYFRKADSPSVRELQREERIAMAHAEWAWTGYGWEDYDCP
jgi:hypothetical protein